jgi:hypothetical protein
MQDSAKFIFPLFERDANTRDFPILQNDILKNLALLGHKPLIFILIQELLLTNFHTFRPSFVLNLYSLP